MTVQKKILFADDEPSLRELYKIRFSMESFKVIFAVDGEDAIKKIKEHKPELVLLDIMMPKKTGMEVLEAIKKDPETSDITAIMLTVLDDENIRNKAFDLGAKYYLVKSQVVPPEVVKIIKQEIYRED